MIQPAELRETRPMKLHGGAVSTTTAVWGMIQAAHDGDLARMQALAGDTPQLWTCQYNYTPPLHLAVREGRTEVVRHLVSVGAVDPTYRSYPFLDPLVTFAAERGHAEIHALLTEALRTPGVAVERGDTGEIDFGLDETETRFMKAVNKDRFKEAKQLLAKRPEMARDPRMSWGEGILMMPARDGNHRLLELLMAHGATVPAMSMWGREYYFKKYATAKFLMERGMSPKHTTWHHVTLLHDMAHAGDVKKAALLLDHGADIDPIDDEYRSTPLGFAARWGRGAMVTFLLERGADPSRSVAPWSTPLAWARSRGHADIEAKLLRAGAR